MTKIYVFLLSLLLSLQIIAQDRQPIKTFVKDNNIYLIFEGGEQKKITDMHVDTLAVLSVDNKLIAFIRKTNGPLIDAGMPDVDNNEICLYDIKTQKLDVIVRSKNNGNPEQVLAGLCNINFSPDSRYIYFESSASWVTSNAIHRFDISTKEEKFITDGNCLKVIREGKYKGYLIVNKHKYYKKGGTYDFDWLVDKDGKEIKELK